MPSLFDIPTGATEHRAGDEDLPAGGIGAGHITYGTGGAFSHWRLHPGVAADQRPSPWDGFHAWARQGRATSLAALADVPHARRRLFPCQWDEYRTDGLLPVRVSAQAFSPIVPGCPREASLPLYVIAWRVDNPTRLPLEAAVMLTWACAWPQLEPTARFDFQHDKLCLTGSLGDPGGADRMGVAMPDLHSQGIYLQGIEPWRVPDEWARIRDDFADDGELDPVQSPASPHGAAAWVKFDLRPGEVKEVPFVVCWHLPVYRSGPAEGCPRYYTQFLEKRRPDNAIVWLAEQAVQDYGSETPMYQYWAQQIGDWQRGRLRSAPVGPAGAPEPDEAAALVRTDTVWDDEGTFVPLSDDPGEVRRVCDLAAALWPDAVRPPGTG